MRRGEMTAARHRLTCLEPIAAADLTDWQRYLLVNCVETYVQWDQAAQEEYEALLAEKGNEKVATMEMTWAGRIAREARESALQEGLEKGREEGKRDLLLDLLERRFGTLPETTVQRVRALTSPEELSRLAGRVLDAPSLDDLGL
jgi:flagellar biosynthesis/type III secretory pathway protein FliH